jgi:hypothetical protein
MTDPLDALVGRWRTDGHVVDQPDVRIAGTDTYRWLQGGKFLVHDVDVVVGDRPVRALELIGEHDDATGTWTACAFDDAGEVTTMRAAVDGHGVLTLTGGAEVASAAPQPGSGGARTVRATLTVAEDRTRMRAIWELSDDGAAWRPWMDVGFTREDEPGAGRTWLPPVPEHRPAPTAPAQLMRLDALVGTWRQLGRSRAGDLSVTGTTTFAWLAGGHFLVEHGVLTVGGRTTHGITVTGWDEVRRACVGQDFGGDGERGSSVTAVDGDEITIHRERVRFSGRIDRRTQAITGVWERSPDGGSWSPWYDAELIPL